MTKEDIIQTLEHLGLSTYEAKAYMALFSEQPLTGYRLSKISGVPRSRIYETIEKLMAKGLVLSQEGDTTLIKPVSLESFLEKKEKENKQNIDFLRRVLPQIQKSTEDQGIWNISGRDQIFEIINHLISRSKKHVYFFAFSNDLRLFETALSQTQKRKVSIFGVYCGDKISEIENLYSHYGQTCSSCQDIALSFDSKQALVGCTFPANGARAALSKNPGIIYITEQYIKHEIFISQSFKIFDKVPLDKLKTIYQQILGKLP